MTEPNALLQEKNMIVDGMKEHIVDMLTRIPAPSSLSADVSATYNVSNFTIQALTVGPNRSAFERVHGLAALSGTVATGNTTTVSRVLDPSDGTVWAYNADVPNHQFSSVNASGGTAPNAQLSNPTFSGVLPRLLNGKFRDYSLDSTLSGVHMNEILGLYNLNGWDVFSFLRYDTTAPEYIDTLELGSCARHDLSYVSSIYSSLSGTAASSTYGEPDDGILFIRSFEHGTSTPSGLVGLSQKFSVGTPDILVESSLDGTDNVLAEITAQFSSLSGGADACIKLSVRDKTDGESYCFSAQGGFGRHSWGSSGAPLVINAAAATSGTISEFINIPSAKTSNTFEVRFQFYAHDASDVLKCYFWNSNVNLLEGWKWGNIFSGQGIHRVWDNDYRNPAIFIDASGSVSSTPTAVPLSSTTYLAQPFSMKPLKKYSIITSFSSTEAFSDAYDIINTAVVKRFSSDPSSVASYNYLTASSCASLVESRLPSHFALSPDYPPTSPPPGRVLQAANIKPSDLCLEVSSGASVSGLFSVSSSALGVLKGDILKTFGTGVSATDNLRLSLRSQELDANGDNRWYNFITGIWDGYTPDEASSVSEVHLDSSSFSGTGFVSFSTAQINLAMLANHLTGSEYEIILSLENSATNPAFIKNLRFDSTPKTFTQDNQEVINLALTDPSALWSNLEYSGQYVLSGLATPGQVFESNANAGAGINALGSYPVEAMYLASGSCHGADSDYRFYLLQSNATSSVTSPGGAGQAYKFNLINIVDDALVAATEPITGDIITSESYVNSTRFDIINEPFFEWEDNTNVYPPSSFVHPGACIQSPQRPAVAGYLTQTNLNLILGTLRTGSDDFPSITLSYVENLKDIHLPLSATQRAFSFEYNHFQNGQQPSTRFRVAATTSDGSVVWWNGTTWDEYDVPPSNAFPAVLQRGNSSLMKTALSTRYDLTNERFDETTKIKTSIVFYNFDAVDVVALRNFKFYTNGPYPMTDMPEFPAPNHTTLQPPASPYAELGHYTNQIQLSASLSSINDDRAIGNINWAPSAGIAVSGTETKSIQNQYGAINSDGYILFGYNGPISVGSRPAYDYYVNGYHVVSSTSSITYTVDVSSGALDYFKAQGGIGAIGLHTLNVNETYRKLIDNGHALGEVYDKGDDPATKLYNLDDVTRNPVFKLAAKKVFRTPLEYTTGAGKFIRFNWEIRFI